MKKNMLAMLILIVLVVDLTLTAYMVFTVVPNAKRTDQLITKIMQIIDLELESPIPSDVTVSWDIKDVEKYELGEMTTNLALGDDGKPHYAVVNASLTINTKDEDYKDLGPKVDVMKSDITAVVKNEISKYSYEEINAADTKAAIKEQILADLQSLFKSKMIVDVTLDYLVQ